MWGIRPRVVCRPTTPEYAAGRRVEPPPSDPTVTGSKRATAAAAPPELDPPGTRVVPQGLSASASQLKGLNTPGLSGSLTPPPPAPIMVLVPTMTAPADR